MIFRYQVWDGDDVIAEVKFLRDACGLAFDVSQRFKRCINVRRVCDGELVAQYGERYDG